MKIDQEAIRIPLQVGSTLRIRNTGELTVDNPELELAEAAYAADAVLSYQFDSKGGEHIYACSSRSRTTNISSYIGKTIRAL
jgi:hypothetical protein